jgi:hypothetical protein
VNRQIGEILAASEGRYLTKAEQATIRDYTSQIGLRMSAMDELQAKESSIVDQAMRKIVSAYPDYMQQHLEARNKGSRDMAMVLRHIAQAVLRNDPQWLDDGLLAWLATILAGVGFSASFIEESYKILEQVTANELSPTSAQLICPFISQCARTLSGRGQ